MYQGSRVVCTAFVFVCTLKPGFFSVITPTSECLKSRVRGVMTYDITIFSARVSVRV